MHTKAPHPAAFRFAILFVSLFIISLPFPYHVIPDIGEYLSPCSERLVRWMGKSVFRIEPPYTAEIVSDSPGMYIHVFALLIISALLSLLWTGIDTTRKDRPALRYLFHAAVSYYLALQLFKYGFDKVFKHQFYLPEPNTLYKPLGYITPDILYWSTIGTSYWYNLLTGLAEIIFAFLLLFRRTRIIGALGATVVVAHIVMINFSFDISVKLYSCFLLLLCLIVAYPGLVPLFDLLIRNRRAEPWEPRPVILSKKNTLFYSIAKALVIVGVLSEALFIYFKTGNFNDDTATRPFLHGAYAVETFVRNNDTLPPLLTENARFKRIFIHRRGYFIAQGMNDATRDYNLGYDIPNRRLVLDENDARAGVLGYTLSNNDSLLVLRGALKNDSVAIHARRIDLESLPLLQRSFHWTIDDYR